MAIADVRDRLQPALLDRITDDAPERGPGAPDDRRVMTRTQLRAAVLRDLNWLFNAVQPLGAGAAALPGVAESVLNFGLPPLAGLLASKVDVSVLERAIREAIIRYEPRLLSSTLEVRAVEAPDVLETHNIVEFVIRGHLWSQPVPLEILLRTQLDLEDGQVEVRDVGAMAPSKAI
jgi:type VI secretion system protein ImpF